MDAASLAAQGCNRAFVEGYIKTHCPVWDQNAEALIDRAFQKFAPPVPPTDSEKWRGFRFLRVGELEFKEPEYLLRPIIEADALVLIFGDPGCGKSFLALDIAARIALGVEANGT